jgi:hypothetical protein
MKFNVEYIVSGYILMDIIVQYILRVDFRLMINFRINIVIVI